MRIDVKEAARFLSENDDYLVLMHANPDGDTLGSGFALCGALQRLGKRARAVCPEEIPHKFDYLKNAVKEQDFEYKTVVCVDVADTKLLGDMKETGDKAELCIDHHLSNRDYAKRTLLKPDCAAACEVIYEVITALKVPFDRELAGCVYTGLATDTGCFKFSNTTPQTHIIAAEMIKSGADFVEINTAHFMKKSKARINLEQEAMRNIRYFANGHIALISAPLSLLERFEGVDSDDLSALSDIPRQIEGVDIGICLKEKKPGVFKASLRSSMMIDVAVIAGEFGGGGHERAAGCSFYGGAIEDAERQIIEACEKACEKAGIAE